VTAFSSAVFAATASAITSGSVEQGLLSMAQVIAALESNPLANPNNENKLSIVFNDNDTADIRITMPVHRRVGTDGGAVFDAVEWLADVAGEPVAQQELSIKIQPAEAPAE
jgi:hypothetical protein